MTRAVVTIIRAAVWLSLAVITTIIVVLIGFALFSHTGY
jgi:hypothetical protein